MAHIYQVVPVTIYELRRLTDMGNGDVLLRDGKPVSDRVGRFETQAAAEIFRDQLVEMDVA